MFKLRVNYNIWGKEKSYTNILNKLHNNFNNISKRNILNVRTRRDRANSGLANPNILVDDVTYYRQMKEFIKETQGVPRNSVKWNLLRNKHYGILREIYVKSQSEDFKETTEVSFVRFYVIVLPEDTDSFELVSILNFYNIKYKALEDSSTSKIILKQMLGSFNKENFKNYKYPFMQFESSEEPLQNLDGIDNIINFMVENNLLHDYRSHSAYEKAGKEFVKQFEEYFELEYKRPLSKFYFYLRFTNFKEAKYWYHPFKDGYIYRNRLFSRIYRMTKGILTDYFTYRKIKNTLLKDSDKKMKQLVETWVERLNGKPFHGGESPDAADFRLYALLRRYAICINIRHKIRVLENLKFEDWESKMSLLTLRNPYYNLRDNHYQLNEYHSEKVLEQTRINKNLREDNYDEKAKTNEEDTLYKSKTNMKSVFANRRTKINTNI